MCLQNIYGVREIEDSRVDSYILWLQEQGIQDKHLIGAYQKTLRDWREFHKEKEFVKLREEIEECCTVEQTLKNRAYTFLTENGIHSLEEIDWDVRVSYDQYLEKTINTRIRPRYLKGLDKLKLFDLEKRRGGIRAGRIQLKYAQGHTVIHALRAGGLRPIRYEEKRIYLGYHPDYQLAKEFYYCRNTKGFLWDFSIHTSQKLKYQVFTVLNYALENSSDRELRRGYLAPLLF